MNPGRRPRAGRAASAPIRLVRVPLVRALLVRTVPLALLLAIGLGSALAQPAAVRARLATGTISIDESVSLVIEASGLDGELDASALERDFEVLSRSSSREVSLLNGGRRSKVTWVLELVPREIGVFTVPPVTVGGIESELLSLTVTEAPTGGEREVFVEAELDTDTPWVQSQVILTLRVFHDVDILDGRLGEPSGEGLEVRALGDDRDYTARRDGREYVVIERRFALFPQRAGTLTIEPITLSLTTIADPSRTLEFSAPTRRLTRRTRERTLEVRARPASVGGWWLPARAVSLAEDWPGGEEARVGEPLTRTVRLEASGALAEQLPAVEAPRVDGLALYADEPVRTDSIGGEGVRAAQTLSLAVIPSREGVFELPAVSVDWFDVARGEARTAVLPARSITVLPGRGEAAPRLEGEQVNAADAGGEEPGASEAVADEVESSGEGADEGAGEGREAARWRWRTIALGALVGWSITALAVALVWRSRRARPASGASLPPTSSTLPETPSQREARERLQAVARSGDLPAFEKAVLARAAAHWPGSPPRTLAALARRVGPAADLAAALAALEAALYRRPDERRGTGTGTDADVGTGAPLDEAGRMALAERLERALRTAPPRSGPAGDEKATSLPPL